MKKKSIKNLSLNKKTIANIKQAPKGGLDRIDQQITDPEPTNGSCGFTCTWCNLSCLVGCVSEGITCPW